ncbi:M48 family metallopeptidase [Anaerobacillus sp. MEB173]|uniref:M48 family metallopeptidase n=1 Tax=Anaerobacillus sp. MEB173 TaxID=3383345 RepID=UPI003F90B969
MRKFFLGFTGVFIIYSIIMSWYLLYGVQAAIPVELQGTAADPQVFMNAEQLKQSIDYARIRDVLYFISIPLEWGIYLFVVLFGISKRFVSWSKEITRFSFVHTTIYVILLSLVSWLLTFPIQWYRFQLSHQYGISNQSFHDWMRDNTISFWVSAFIMTIIVYVLYALIQRTQKRWWLYAWLLSIPFTLLMMFIQPVIIDPLYNDFYPIQDIELEQEILALAAQAEIPADHVYEVNMSEKTNALNAYVNGIGNNLRIVLWDTTLQSLTKDEVLFVMAHEMGHYVLHHLHWLVIGTIAMSLVGLYVTYRLYTWVIKRFGRKLGISGTNDLAALPVILLILSLLSFAASPFMNMISREYEYEADRYAIELTEDVDAAVGAFQQLAVQSLSDVNPPGIVKVFRYTHPPMIERITYLQSFAEE